MPAFFPAKQLRGLYTITLCAEGVFCKNDHIIFDELYFNHAMSALAEDREKIFLQTLEDLSAKVSSIWIAFGAFDNYSIVQPVESVESLGYQCIILENCLRNGLEIDKCSKALPGLMTPFRQKNVKKSQSRLTAGHLETLSKMDCFDEITALKMTLLDSNETKCFIFLSITGAKNEMCQLKKMMRKTKDGQHLVFQEGGTVHPKVSISGMEFESMIYVAPKCDICSKEECYAHATSRAKASLLMVHYSTTCGNCLAEEAKIRYDKFRINK